MNINKYSREDQIRLDSAWCVSLYMYRPACAMVKRLQTDLICPL